MEHINFAPLKPEPHMEPPVAPPKKRHVFKIKTYTMDDKYDAMRAILQADATAEFKVTGDWSLKVRTELTYNEMMATMIFSRSFNRLKRAWFF